MESRCDYSLIVDPAETEIKALRALFDRKQTESILILKKQRDTLSEHGQILAEIAQLIAELESSTNYSSVFDYLTPGFFEPAQVQYKKQMGERLDDARIRQQALERDLEQTKSDYAKSIKKIEKIIHRILELKKEISLPAERKRQEDYSPTSV
jgi:nitrate reductase assembly molybdenum cofactor insertion protein NarJ